MSGLNGVEIFLGYSCNQRCGFCFQKDLRLHSPHFLEYNDVIDVINQGNKEGKRALIFSGGEATLDKNLINYILHAKTLGYTDVRVHTNALSFSKKEVLKTYLDAGITGIIISIHGYGKIHDILVKYEGAFAKVTKALVNISYFKAQGYTIDLDTNTVLLKGNYTTLFPLFKFLSYFPINRSQIVQMYSLYLFSFSEKKSMYISYGEFSPYLEKILEIPGNQITLENFPFCKIDALYWKHILERERYDNDAYGNMGEGFEESDCSYIDTCKDCKLKEKCSGIPKDYQEIYPKEEFTL